MKTAANIASIIFHPLLMVPYGILLALNYTYLAIYSQTMKFHLAGSVFLCTAVIPGLFILLMIKQGAAADMELTNRRERTLPYLILIASNIACLFYLFKMEMPFWLLSLFAGICLALFIALFINFVWKISAHAIGVGGLLGAVMGVAHIQMLNPYKLFICILLAAGIVCTARIILQKHTPMQAYAGFVLGFAATFGASFTSFIFILIQ
jgi:hypothetical protein